MAKYKLPTRLEYFIAFYHFKSTQDLCFYARKCPSGIFTCSLQFHLKFEYSFGKSLQFFIKKKEMKIWRFSLEDRLQQKKFHTVSEDRTSRKLNFEAPSNVVVKFYLKMTLMENTRKYCYRISVNKSFALLPADVWS